MADVEMSDAPVAKKAEGSNSKSVEGKKKFEVKKVQNSWMLPSWTNADRKRSGMP